MRWMVIGGSSRCSRAGGSPRPSGPGRVRALARDRAGLEDSIEDKGWASAVAVLDAALALRSVKN